MAKDAELTKGQSSESSHASLPSASSGPVGPAMPVHSPSVELTVHLWAPQYSEPLGAFHKGAKPCSSDSAAAKSLQSCPTLYDPSPPQITWW